MKTNTIKIPAIEIELKENLSGILIEKISYIRFVQIENYGIIKKAEIEFKDGLNIIAGKSASGKSTIIKYLLENQNSIKSAMSAGEKVLNNMHNALGFETILIDNCLGCLDHENLFCILNKMLESKKQIIVTMHEHYLSKIKNKIKANIINTKDFELNV